MNADIQNLREIVSSSRREMVKFLCNLISVASENPPGKYYRKCVGIIVRKLRQIGLEPFVLEVPGQKETEGKAGHTRYPRFCVFAFYGPGDRTLYFHGHYDVVPAIDRTQFEPCIREGRVYGRGASDMKGGLVSMIYAVKLLMEAKVPLNGKIGLVFVPDEETGGYQGSNYLNETGQLGKDGIGMLTPEPTAGVIWNASRGALSLRVDILGKPAHTSLHWLGINAFEKMILVAHTLLKFRKTLETRKTHFPISPEQARNSILMIGGQCGSGLNFNALPGRSWFTIDRRINPEEKFEQEKQRLFSLLHRFENEGIDIRIETLQEGKPSSSDEKTLLARSLVRGVETVRGIRPDFQLCPGLLETRFYAGRGIPAYAYGPGLLSVSHGPDEYVAADEVISCSLVYALTAAWVLQS